MKSIAVLVLFLIGFNTYSQDELNLSEINNYKYIIIPQKFDFLKEADQFNINSLTKFLFNKYGYTAFLENDLFPEDLNLNRCITLQANVVKIKGAFLRTKLQINLKDCKGNLVATSKVGMSREKDYKSAYNFALREAFKTFQNNKYSYIPKANVVSSASNESSNSTKPNVEQVKAAQQEIERLKQEVAALKEEQEVEETEIIPVAEAKTEKIESPKELVEEDKTLYAQSIEKGFQVVDSTPKVVMILLETPKQNTFIVKDQNAIVYKEDGFWYLSKNDGNSTSLETLNIKF